MIVLVIGKTTFAVTQLNGVTNIAYNISTDNYTITYAGESGSTSTTVPAKSYNIQIVWR